MDEKQLTAWLTFGALVLPLILLNGLGYYVRNKRLQERTAEAKREREERLARHARGETA